MEVLTGALPSVITKLAGLAAGEYNLQKGLMGEIKFLQEELESMKAALEDISRTPAEQLPNNDKIWSRNVRELSYDIEDSIDTFMVQCKDKGLGKQHGLKKVIDRSLHLLMQPKVRHKIAKEVREIKSRVMEVHERRRRYEVNLGVDKPVTVDPRLFTQYTEMKELVGIEEARDEFINKFLTQGNNVPMKQGKTVSIFGFGGLGKTTLANAVYEKIRAQFDCCAFVSVSQTPDLKRLFKGLLNDFGESINEEILDESRLIKVLREFLQDKMYIVVVDDIWDISVWKRIRFALPDNDVGYTIITTTRIADVAEQAGGAYKLKPLSSNNSRKLFFRRIFGDKNKDSNKEIEKCPDDELAEVSDRILKKCAGAPLAIITMASLLACKARNKLEWYEVYNSVGTGMENNMDVENMRKMLSFSYYELLQFTVDINMAARKSASLGAMGSLLRKLDALLHTKEGVPNIIRQLREDVISSIGTKLVELSEVHDPPLTVNYWMKEARELSYDIEDCVDKFVHADSDAKMAWIDEISGLMTRVEEVVERYHRFKLADVHSRPTVTNAAASHHLRMAYLQDANHVEPVGMEGPKNEILGLLKPKANDENELQLKVIAILGVEGIGKSTLAQELWRVLVEEFECHALVRASKKPDMRMILRSILLQVRPHHQPEAYEVPHLIHSISMHLQDKRYFIIIDDLWTVSVWDTISRAFPEGNSSSRIITATSIEDVALACCSYDPGHIFKMKSLSCDHSKELFMRTVFGSGQGCPRQFHAVLDEISRKCGGLPLAITCIATLLARQPETVDPWDYISNFLNQNLRSNPTPVEILKQILNLCYIILPNCLKTCLLYLSVYPENYIILKDDLVKQWIAEDFVCAKEEQDTVEVASSYFDELVSLCLIQRTDINCIKKGRSYIVHPMVFDFIRCKSVEDNFITIINYSQSTVGLIEKIRRLSLHFGSATYATTPASIGLSQVRSLSFIGLLCCMPSLVQFELVRVLILHLQAEDGDTTLPLRGISGMFLLRYLQVRCNFTVELPEQLGCLKHLATLEINARVAAVPSDIVCHPSLLQVRLGAKTKHKHLTLSDVTSSRAMFPDDLSSVPSPDVVQEFELLPPICSFSRLPAWFQRLHGLRVLEVVVRELWEHDVLHLGQLPVLTALSLYVRKPSVSVTFYGKAFPVLKYFKLVSGAFFLIFLEEALPNLQRLKIGFNVHRREMGGNMLVGVHHLLNLQEVAASIGQVTGADDTDRMAAESKLQDAMGKHPCCPSFKVTRVDPIDEEYDLPHPEIQDLSHETESSNKGDKVLNTHEACKDVLSNHQPFQAEVPREDMMKHDDTCDGQHQTQGLERAGHFVLLLSTLVASVTFQAGLNPQDVFGQSNGEGTTSLTRYNAFICFNSVAFLVSLVVIILIQKGVLLKHQKVVETMILLETIGVIGAFITGPAGGDETTSSIIMITAGNLQFSFILLNAMLPPDPTGISRSRLTGTEPSYLLFPLLNLLIIVVAYHAALNPPSGFWYESRLHAGDPALLGDYRLHRYKQSFFYCNSLSYILFLLFVILGNKKLHTSGGPSLKMMTLFLVGSFVVMIIQLVKMTSATTFIALMAVVMFYVLVFMVLSSRDEKANNNNNNTVVVENDVTSNTTTPDETEDGIGRKWLAKGYLMHLGIQTASVTYHTGLAPLGGFWLGGGVSNPLIQDNWRRPRYLIFLCGNTASFAASVAVIVLLLLQLLRDNKRLLSRVMNTMMVLGLLGLLVAYAAGSCRTLQSIAGPSPPAEIYPGRPATGRPNKRLLSRVMNRMILAGLLGLASRCIALLDLLRLMKYTLAAGRQGLFRKKKKKKNCRQVPEAGRPVAGQPAPLAAQLRGGRPSAPI